MSAADRFWRYVVQTDDCWEWIGTTSGAGYGHFHVSGGRHDRVREYAHRWAYEHLIGPIPEGLELDHLCRNRRCVNPAHLEPVTHAENRRRGRGVAYKPQDLGPTCRAGHPRNAENVGLDSSGYRICRICRRESVKRYRERRKKAPINV